MFQERTGRRGSGESGGTQDRISTAENNPGSRIRVTASSTRSPIGRRRGKKASRKKLIWSLFLDRQRSCQKLDSVHNCVTMNHSMSHPMGEFHSYSRVIQPRPDDPSTVDPTGLTGRSRWKPAQVLWIAATEDGAAIYRATDTGDCT